MRLEGVVRMTDRTHQKHVPHMDQIIDIICFDDLAKCDDVLSGVTEITSSMASNVSVDSEFVVETQ